MTAQGSGAGRSWWVDVAGVVIALAVAIVFPLAKGSAIGSVLVVTLVGVLLGAAVPLVVEKWRPLVALVVLIAGAAAAGTGDRWLSASWLGGVLAAIIVVSLLRHGAPSRGR